MSAADPVESALDAALRNDADAAGRMRRRIGAALLLGVLALVAMVGAAVVLFVQDQVHGRWVDHTYAAEAKISDLATDVERVETARRGALLNPADGSYRATYLATVVQLSPELEDLARFTSDNPNQRANIARLRPLIDTKKAQLVATMDRLGAGKVEEARALFLLQARVRATQQMRTVLANMGAEELRLLKVRSLRERVTSEVLLVLVLGALVLLALVVVTAGVLMWRYAADLRRTQAGLRELNEELEDRVRGRTAELTRANEEIQRFAYIVSHDLRSPLVNVMGFTSELEAGSASLGKLLAAADAQAPGLVERDARSFIEEEIPEAIGFIRSSTRKMDRLINAILRLSREGRRTLNPEPLAMDALAQGVADSLRQLSDGKGATITVDEPLPDLVSDRVAIEQLVSNLTENAVKYLSPQRPGQITIRGRAQGSRAVFEVADNGRGIDARDHERIFDLFRRSGQQDQPGEGIGLAHVRALVYRLGGHITVDSDLGRGSTFRVDLPRRLERESS